MLIYLVRHTRVEVPPGICYGASDVALAPTFLQDAVEVTKKGNSLSIDKCYSSPAKRCTQLADIIVGTNRYEQREALRELNFGDWELSTWEDIYASEEGKYWMDHYESTVCPNGESFQQQRERVAKFYAQELRTSGHQSVLLFTHAGTIRAFLCEQLGLTAHEAFNIPLAYGAALRFDTADNTYKIY